MDDLNPDQSFLSGGNATFINDLHKEWKNNPNSVPKEWYKNRRRRTQGIKTKNFSFRCWWRRRECN